MHQTYTVEKDFHNSRFDRWFKAKVKDLPQSLIEKIIRQNKVKLNNKKVKYKEGYSKETGRYIEQHCLFFKLQ